MNNKKLIKLVKDQPMLYDKKHKSYSKHDVKTEIWNEIGKVMNTNGERCKYKWKILRAQYAREILRMNMPSETGAKKKKKWMYYDVLSFLNDYLDPRLMERTVMETPDLEESQNGFEQLDEFVEENDDDDFSCSQSKSSERSESRGRDVKSVFENFRDHLAKDANSKNETKAKDEVVDLYRESRGRDFQNLFEMFCEHLVKDAPNKYKTKEENEVDLYCRSMAKIINDQKLTSLQFLELQAKLTITLKNELQNMQCN